MGDDEDTDLDSFAGYEGLRRINHSRRAPSEHVAHTSDQLPMANQILTRKISSRDEVATRRQAALPSRPASRRRKVSMKLSRSPSSTAWTLPVSKPVRWSFTSVYGCS